MDFFDQHWMATTGAVLIFVGLFVRWRTGRHNLQDELVDSAWQIARGRRTAENPTPTERRFRQLKEQPGVTRKMQTAVGAVVRHVISQSFAVITLIMILLGIVLIGLDVYWT